MGRGETTQNTKRRQTRISTKYRKEYDVHYRYDEFIQKCLNKYRIDHDLDVGTKNTKLMDGILREYFEMKTIEEFCREDPDLKIKMEKQKEKQYWIDFVFDHCDMREVAALRQACTDILEIKANSKYKY